MYRADLSRSGREKSEPLPFRQSHRDPGKRHPLVADGDDSLEAGSRFWPRSAHHQSAAHTGCVEHFQHTFSSPLYLGYPLNLPSSDRIGRIGRRKSTAPGPQRGSCLPATGWRRRPSHMPNARRPRRPRRRGRCGLVWVGGGATSPGGGLQTLTQRRHHRSR